MRVNSLPVCICVRRFCPEFNHPWHQLVSLDWNIILYECRFLRNKYYCVEICIKRPKKLYGYLFCYPGALSEDNISLRSSPSKTYRLKPEDIQEGYRSDDNTYPEVDSDGEVLDVPEAKSVETIKSEELTKNNSFRWIYFPLYIL